MRRGEVLTDQTLEPRLTIDNPGLATTYWFITV